MIYGFLNTKCIRSQPTRRAICQNAGIRNITCAISASEAHNKANINRTHEEALEELQKILSTLPDMNVTVGLPTVFACPFTGWVDPFSLHLHDTRGMGLVNTLAGMMAGINSFETSVGGLGGCPFAPGAAGNTATEDMINMLGDMKIETGINLEKLLDTVKLVQEKVDAAVTDHMAKAKIYDCFTAR